MAGEVRNLSNSEATPEQVATDRERIELYGLYEKAAPPDRRRMRSYAEHGILAVLPPRERPRRKGRTIL